VAFVIGFQLVLVGVCFYAFWRGGTPERLAGLAGLVAAAATIIVNLRTEAGSERLEVEVLIVDLVLLVFLVWLAVKANRFWPLWMTAAHGIAIAVHLAKAATPEIDWPVYTFFSKGSALAVLAILWLGTLRHRRRLRTHGSDPPWRRF